MLRPLFLIAALSISGTASGHGREHAPATPSLPLEAVSDAPVPAGLPGDPAMVDRDIEVSMYEDGAEMLFAPRAMQFAAGETVRFSVVNHGVIAHELVIDTPERNRRHKAAMMAAIEAGHGSVHHDHNAVLLEPGESGALIWTFTQPGIFEFACLLPGHQEHGMSGPIAVLDTQPVTASFDGAGE